MDRLQKICTKEATSLLLSQMLIWKDELEWSGAGKIEVEHRFRFNITKNNKRFVVNINALDHEFFVIDENEVITMFRCVGDMKVWFRLLP